MKAMANYLNSMKAKGKLKASTKKPSAMESMLQKSKKNC